MPQCRQTVWSQGPQRLPGPLELVDLANEAQQIRRKYQILERIQRHNRKYTREITELHTGIFGYPFGCEGVRCERALHKKSWAVIDRPYSLGSATVGALYERPRSIFCAKPLGGSSLLEFSPHAAPLFPLT